MKYVYPFNIEKKQLELIQKEMLNFIEINKIFNKRGYILKIQQLENECPITLNFIKSISKFKLNPMIPAKLFFTPPNEVLLPHIDPSYGPMALNIPIANTANTTFSYYNTDPSNIGRTEKISLNGLGHAPVPKDLSLLEEVETIELTTPYLVRTDILHGVVNKNNTTRIILSIRWIEKSKEFNKYL